MKPLPYYTSYYIFTYIFGVLLSTLAVFGLCIDLHLPTGRSNTAYSPNNEKKLLNGGIDVREPQRLRFRGLACKSCLMSLPQSWAGPTTQVVSKDPDRSQEGRDAQRREEHPLWN